MNCSIEQIDWSKWNSTEDDFAKYAHVKSKISVWKTVRREVRCSIMISAFCRAELLKEAIDSALNQKTGFCYTGYSG